MRIYLAFPARANVAIPESRIWIAHVQPTLTSMGHEVIPFDVDYDELLSDGLPEEERSRRRTVASDRLLAQVSEAHARRPLDLFLSYFYTGAVVPEVVTEIRRLGVLTVNFSCNNVHQFYTVRDLASLYDYCMVPERAALEKFRAVNARPVHIQMGANPDLFKPLGLPKRHEVIFVGAKYADRAAFVSALVRAKLPIRVWGVGWKRESVGELVGKVRRAVALGGAARLVRSGLTRLQGWKDDQVIDRVTAPPLSDSEMVEVYDQSQIALNFSKALDEEQPGLVHRHIRLRDFEVPMTGVCYMPEFSDEIGEYYEIGREVITFQTPDELVEKTKYYLVHEEERGRIARAGCQRARAEHTWQRRFDQLFRAIGLRS